MKCRSCGHDNSVDSLFCQKCGKSLFIPCKRCGASNMPEAVFCKSCGTNLMEAQFALSTEAVGRWRSRLGSIPKWNLTNKVYKEFQGFLARIDPPFDPNAEPVIFWVEMIYGPDLGLGGFRVLHFATEDVKITLSPGFVRAHRAFLVATDSRLIAFNADKRVVCHIDYDKVTSLSAEVNRHGPIVTLHLSNGREAVIATKMPHASITGVVAIMTAQTNLEKEMIASRMRQTNLEAQDFVDKFVGFFAEIVAENRKRGG